MVFPNNKILILDDEKDIRDICANVLSRHYNFEIFKVGSLSEARKVVEQEKPSYAILDLNLPDGEGLELVPSLKSSNNYAEFIVVTAHNHCSDKEKALNLGASSFISKPFTSKDLKGAFDNMLKNTNYENK